MSGSSNSFGKSSNSLLGSSSVFGQTNSPNNIPFAALPSGCTSAAVFTHASSPVFGASSAPAFGSSMPAFVASSSPAFGSSVYGQKPATGNFGSTTQSSSIGSSFQQSQPAFGSNGSSPFVSSSQPAFASLSTSAIGTSSTHAFGATSTPAFGSTSTPTFGNTGFTSGNSGFGFSAPAFGASTPAFGASSTPAFGTSSTPAFRTSSTPAFVSSPTPAFGATSSSFSFWSSPTSGQSTCAFGSSLFGATSTAFGAQTSPFGGQTTTPGADNASGTQVVSISAMGTFQEKSHEELRWEYHQLKNLGGLNHAAQSSGGMGCDMNNTQQTNHPFASSSPAANLFSSTTSTNPFVPKNSTFGAASSTPSLGSSPFGAATSNPFGLTPSQAPSAFGSTPTRSSYLFGAPSSSAIGSSIPIYGTQAQGTTSAFGTGLNFEKLESISAMPAYKEKSHEELKWEYCQLRNKGDPNPAAPFSGGMDFKITMKDIQQTNPFASSSAPAFGQSSANPFNLTISTNPFAPKTSTFGTLGSESSNPSLDSSPSTLILIFNFKTMHLT